MPAPDFTLDDPQWLPDQPDTPAKSKAKPKVKPTPPKGMPPMEPGRKYSAEGGDRVVRRPAKGPFDFTETGVPQYEVVQDPYRLAPGKPVRMPGESEVDFSLRERRLTEPSAPTTKELLEGHRIQGRGGVTVKRAQRGPFDFRTPDYVIEQEPEWLDIGEPVQMSGETEGQFGQRRARFNERQRRQDLRQHLDPTREPSTIEKLRAGDITKGVVEPFVAGLAEPIRQAGVAMRLLAEKVGGRSIRPEVDPLQAGLGPTLSDDFLARVFQGLGSSGTFVLTSILTGPTGVALYGAASNAGQTYEEALRYGVTEEQAREAAVVGALFGLTEGLGAGHGAGAFSEVRKDIAQEVISQALNNVNAKVVSGYDPKRAVTDGTFEAALISMVTSGAMGSVGALAQRLPAQGGRVESEVSDISQIRPVDFTRKSEVGGSAHLAPLVDREANARAFVAQADPRLRLEDESPRPVYHGTQSLREITEVDFSKLDSNALYGPGFYTTQDPEVAAGEEGYAQTKTPYGLDKEWEWYNFYVKEVAQERGLTNEAEYVNDASLIEEANRRLNEKLAGKPHAYKLYLDIRRPFDIDAPVQATPELVKAISAWTGESVITSERRIAKARTGNDLYTNLLSMGDGLTKAEVNQMLSEAGYDGITHIGGLGKSVSPKFSNVDEAVEYADRVGGRIKGITEYNEDGSNKWVVEGHRVWIAFRPEQVKSATGNVGTFDPTRPELSAHRPTQPRPRIKPIDPNAYNLVTPPEKGKSPVLRAPRHLFQALESFYGVGINGYRIALKDVGWLKALAQRSLPEAEAREAISQIDQAVAKASERGLRSIALVDTSASESVIESVTRHETWHVGQGQVAPQFAGRLDALHDSEWARAHSVVAKAAASPFGQQVGTFKGEFNNDLFTYELAAYVAEGAAQQFGLTTGEGIEFLVEYLEHLDGKWGRDGLDALAQAAWLRPNIDELFTYLRSYLDGKQSTDAGRTGGPDAQIIGPDPSEASPHPMDREVAGAPPLGSLSRPSEGGPEGGTPAGPPPVDPAGGPVDEGPPPGLYDEVVANVHTKTLTQGFIDLLRSGAIRYQRGVAPSLQVHAAIVEGRLRPEDVEALLGEHGLTWDDFADEALATASYLGQGLGYYSFIERNWARFEKESPQLAERLAGPRRRAQAAMRSLESSLLNRNMRQRLGGTMQKMVLTQMSTAATNTLTTVGRIPVEMASQGLGSMLEALDPRGPMKGRSLNERLAKGSKDAVDAMAATLEVARALSPHQLAQVWRGQRDETAYQRNLDIVLQLEKAFPDLHRKLVQMSMGPETLPEAGAQISLIQSLLPQIKDQATRVSMLRKLTKYEARMASNTRGVGKLLSMVEAPYDFMLKPMQFSEFLLRRPMFVGQLGLELGREGIDLEDVLARGALQEVPKDAVERAVNKALEFTFAYMPSVSGPGAESIGYDFIQAMNRLGPLSFVAGEPFAKAMYNGLKFLYEYSFVGAIAPGARWIGQRQVADPRTGEMVNVNPMRHSDYERFGRAMVGTLMYAMAYLGREALFGDEWWQLKTGKRTKDGRPVYIDIRRWHPFSDIVHLVDLTKRIGQGRAIDKKVGVELAEILTGQRVQSPGAWETIDAMAQWWGGQAPGGKGALAARQAGQGIAIPLTPLLNLRDLVAQFSEQENRRKDTSDKGLLGPSLDRLPWIRRAMPDLTLPTEPSPIELSRQPAVAQFMGIKSVAGAASYAREWQRLGLSPSRFLQRDPDPLINRKQNETFVELMTVLGDAEVASAAYQAMSDVEKAAKWEQLAEIVGPAARAQAQGANPAEGVRRQLRGTMGPLQRKAAGIDKVIEQVK